MTTELVGPVMRISFPIEEGGKGGGGNTYPLYLRYIFFVT